jgi:hypothetical protein
MTMEDINPGPYRLEDVLERERSEIEAVRRKRDTPERKFTIGEVRRAAEMPDGAIPGRTVTETDEPDWQKNLEAQKWREVIAAAHKANHVGLAFSGGGIRSATFNLGVLQALADLKLLYRIDYLSTVSGGGYIGGWLAAWTSRLRGFEQVQQDLASKRVHQEDDNEPRPIRFLRVFSNYLTPKLGIFSGDTWAIVGIYLRNLLLNLAVVLLLLAAVILLPRFAENWAVAIGGLHASDASWMTAALALMLLAFLTIVNNMAYLDDTEGGARQLTEQKWILGLAGVPLFLMVVLAAVWQVTRFKADELKAPLPYGEAAGAGSIGYGVIWIATAILGLIYRQWIARQISKILDHLEEMKGMAKQKEMPESGTSAPPPAKEFGIEEVWKVSKEFVITLIAALVAGAFAGWLYALLSASTLCWSPREALAFGVPLVLGIFLLAGTLHIGLMGIVFRDPRREWWARLGGWLLVWGLLWAAIFWVALYFPHFIEHSTMATTTWKAIAKKYLTPTWIATTAGGILAGKGQSTGKPGTLTWKDILAKVSPHVFVVGLVCWISWGIDEIQSLHLFSGYGLIANHRLYAAWIGCVLVSVIMAWRVDINQFSMNLFYRNRLVRCYLGASNNARSPNRFTGFDPGDDKPLKDLRSNKGYNGPYPVMNASLNLVKGKDLAWQERKAESFVMTPLFCGYDVWLEQQDSPMMRSERRLTKKEVIGSQDGGEGNGLKKYLRVLDRYGYRPTENYAFPPPGHGLNMGIAMAISGAAASPSMGFYTSAPVAFLMTIFNVRLGQWLGNPRHSRTWDRPTPRVGLLYLLNELLGGTDDEAAFVYLSDGGHFENMGLYELVKRRCGLIIVGDAEADGNYGFQGLGNAIRKCRIDMGIDIDLDVSEIAPQKVGKPSKKHCAVGTIHYENADMNAPSGKIIYFKSSLTGDESTDVKNYKTKNGSFPHESTINQWFSESQFEAYRELGHHAVVSSIETPPRDSLWHALTAPKQLHEELREIFKTFGFETSKLG